jgi:hypothetical protein
MLFRQDWHTGWDKYGGRLEITLKNLPKKILKKFLH